ncbi:MAG TPA: glycosyl hydrolase [Phycisphaerae bacterium]|nr:glycosyl hydrolase [Phycisphaerae bacterium]
MNPKFLDEFHTPPSPYRGAPFWAWNGRLEPAELRRQIRVMHRMGLGGFFMHSRVGLATPYLADEWFECVGACIDEAEKLDMQAWLYDEDRWPSGAAGGLVTRNPRFRQRAVVMRRLTRPRDLTWDRDVLAAFTARVRGNAATGVKRLARGRRPGRLAQGDSILVFRVEVSQPSSWYNGQTYLDTLSHEAVREFIRVTHKAYEKRCGGALGRRVPGIFTDEPNHGRRMSGDVSPALGGAAGGISAPWTQKLPQVFRKRYRYDVVARLPEVFLDVDGRPFTPARLDYHDCVTHLFVDAFARQIGEWCDRTGMQHTGHVLCEETLASQTSVVGAGMRFYEHMQAPGIDILTEYQREYDTAKQVSSVARQFGRTWRLTETYGCTGWDFPFAGHKAVGDWQAALGINLRCPHLAWYTMEGQAKRDYPASILDQSPWWEVYEKVEDYFARVHVAMTRGREVRDLLVIRPIESMWALCRAGWQNDPAVAAYDQAAIDLRDTLLGANIDFDYGDEDILARHGKVGRSGGAATLKVAGAAYKAAVVPPMLTIGKTTLALLERFRKAGGTVVFAGAPAAHVDGKPASGAEELASACTRTSARGARLVKAVEPTCRRVSIADAAGNELRPALHLLREDRDAFYLFVCNTGHDYTRGLKGVRDRGVRLRTVDLPDVRVSGPADCRGQPLELDTETGKVFAADARRRGSGWEVRTSLAPLGSRVFVFPKSASRKVPPRRRKMKTVRKQTLAGARWNIALSEENNLVLDRPRFRIDGGRPRAADDVLEADHAVRDALGIPRRGGQMVQPWMRPPADPGKHVAVTLNYTFDVRAIPSGALFLALEQPHRYRVAVNGLPVNTDADAGWWVDRSLRRLPVDPAVLRLGTNDITLACDYDADHPGLEIIYLLGAFGTKVQGTRVTMTRPPAALAIGNWVKQGLAFYGGSVTYRRTIRPRRRGVQRVFVCVPEYRGVGVRILVDGQPAGVIAWQPNEIDITDFLGAGTAELGIQVLGHRRNSHGPLHQKATHPRWTGPDRYGVEQAEYNLVPCGLMAPPQLVVRA